MQEFLWQLEELHLWLCQAQKGELHWYAQISIRACGNRTGTSGDF